MRGAFTMNETHFYCDKEMVYLGGGQCDICTAYSDIWICGICGFIHKEMGLDLDEEELADLMGNYAELKGTEIYEELLGGAKDG